MTSRFGPSLSDTEFRDNCTQLTYDIERMEHEAAEFGLLDRHQLIASFGPDQRATAESFLRVWGEQRANLMTGIAGAADTMKSFDRSKASAAVSAFFLAMRPENRRFIQIAMETYRAEMVHQLKMEEAQAPE